MKSKKEYDIEIGEIIRKARKRKKMNQEDLAKILEVDRTTIAKYETGSNPINMSTFFQICEILGEDPLEVLGGI